MISFKKWKLEVVQSAQDNFGIDLELFYSDEELQGYQIDGDSPEEFVLWFADKHCLEPVTYNPG